MATSHYPAPPFGPSSPTLKWGLDRPLYMSIWILAYTSIGFMYRKTFASDSAMRNFKLFFFNLQKLHNSFLFVSIF